MTYRFGRISKAWLRKTAIPRIDPDWDRDNDPRLLGGTGIVRVVDPDAAERGYAGVPGLPETYGSLGYASMGIGSMDRSVAARRKYAGGAICESAFHCDPGEVCLNNECHPVMARTSPTRRTRKRKPKGKRGRRRRR